MIKKNLNTFYSSNQEGNPKNNVTGMQKPLHEVKAYSGAGYAQEIAHLIQRSLVAGGPTISQLNLHQQQNLNENRCRTSFSDHSLAGRSSVHATPLH